MYLHGCVEVVNGFLPGIESLSYGGRMEYAASNDIIMIMPQVKFNLLFNAGECFDVENTLTRFTDPDAYLTKRGR